jgi:hypothetical protein
MKKTGVLFLFVVWSVSGYAQSNNWYFSFSMGRSWPLGTFSKSDIDDNTCGYAQKGFTLLLDATYPLNDHWGLKGMTLLNSNPVDQNGLGAKLEKRMNTYITVDEADREYLSLKVNSWMWNALMVGPVYTINLNRIYWDLQLVGGLNITYLPQQKLQYEKPSNNWYYLDRNTTTTNASYGISAGSALRFPVLDRVNLKIGIDYYRSQALIKSEQIKVSKQGETELTETLGQGSSTVPLEMFTVSVGFVYYLN